MKHLARLVWSHDAAQTSHMYMYMLRCVALHYPTKDGKKSYMLQWLSLIILPLKFHSTCQEIFQLTKSMGENPKLLMTPHTITAGENFRTIF